MSKEKNKKKEREITVKANKKGRHVMPLLGFLKILIVPFFCLIKPFRFYGNKKVKDGACIYVCNHFSIWDIVYPAVTTKEGIHYVAKNEVMHMPIIGGIAKQIKTVCVNRDHKDVRGLLDCFKCLKNGEKICLFPEGTRNTSNEELLPLQAGAAMMSIRCKAPIIPMMIYEKPKCFKTAHVIVGEPFEFTEYYDKKLSDTDMQAANDKLYSLMIDLRKKHAEFLQSRKKKATA